MNNAKHGRCKPASKLSRVRMWVWTGVHTTVCVRNPSPQPPTSRCLQHEVSELAGKGDWRGAEEGATEETRLRWEKISGGGICRAEQVQPINGSHAEPKDQTDQKRYSTLCLYYICNCLLSGAASHKVHAFISQHLCYNWFIHHFGSSLLMMFGF